MDEPTMLEGKVGGGWVKKMTSLPYLLVVSIVWWMLVRAPDFWERWQAGGRGWLIGGVYLVLIVGVGGVAFYYGRRREIDSWVWKGWVVTVLSLPFLAMAFDTTSAHILRFIILLWTIVIGFYFVIKQGSGDTTRGLIIILLSFVPFLLLVTVNSSQNFFDVLGPCHVFSELRGRGCERSLILTDDVAVLFGHDPDTGGDLFIRAYESAVWIEPLNRLEAVVGSRVIKFEDSIDYLSVNADGTRIRAVNFTGSPALSVFQIVGKENGYTYSSLPVADSLIDTSTGKIIDQFHLDSHEFEEVRAYLGGVETEQAETDDEPELKTVYSNNGRVLAVLNDDGSVGVWENTKNLPNPMFTILDPINPVSQELFLSTGEPDWSFVPDVEYVCMSFSADGGLMAGTSEDALDVYDVALRELVYSVPIEYGDCPVFSDNGRYLAFTQGPAVFTVVDSDSRAIVSTIDLDDFIIGLDFSANGDYLVVTHVSDYGPEAIRGLVFDMGELVGAG